VQHELKKNSLPNKTSQKIWDTVFIQW